MLGGVEPTLIGLSDVKGFPRGGVNGSTPGMRGGVSGSANGGELELGVGVGIGVAGPGVGVGVGIELGHELGDVKRDRCGP